MATSSFLLLFIFGAVASASSLYLRRDRDLTDDQLMNLIRPTLPSDVQSLFDEIRSDPVLRRLDRVDTWQRIELAIERLMENATYRSIIMKDRAMRMAELSRTGIVSETFPCKPFPPSKRATSVHELTPGDINVVAAMGDSLTAGTGINAKSILGLLLQYRGNSWSIGGEYEYERNPMFPNILRKYNNELYGFSTGICKDRGACSHFNVAIPGKTARDMAAQARDLVMKMKASPVVDIKHDWKVVSIFIGQNDICSSSCKKPTTYSVEAYSARLRDALNILSTELPRTFVNLVTMVDAYECKNLNIGVLCTLLHVFECPCAAFDPFYDETRALNEAYQREVNDVAALYSNYRTDFVVVVQPFFKKTVLPRGPGGEVDLSYFAPDCFHFSAKGHAAAAKSLWNSMLEPVGKKKLSWHAGEPFQCPTPQNPYFCTPRNCGSV